MVFFVDNPEEPSVTADDVLAARRILSQAGSRSELFKFLARGGVPFNVLTVLCAFKPGWVASFLMTLPFEDAYQIQCDLTQLVADRRSAVPLSDRAALPGEPFRRKFRLPFQPRFNPNGAVSFISFWVTVRACDDEVWTWQFWDSFSFGDVRTTITKHTPFVTVLQELINLNYLTPGVFGNPRITDQMIVDVTFSPHAALLPLAGTQHLRREDLHPRMSYQFLSEADLVDRLVASALDEHPFDLDTFYVLGRDWVGSFADLVEAARSI